MACQGSTYFQWLSDRQEEAREETEVSDTCAIKRIVIAQEDFGPLSATFQLLTIRNF